MICRSNVVGIFALVATSTCFADEATGQFSGNFCGLLTTKEGWVLVTTHGCYTAKGVSPNIWKATQAFDSPNSEVVGGAASQLYLLTTPDLQKPQRHLLQVLVPDGIPQTIREIPNGFPGTCSFATAAKGCFSDQGQIVLTRDGGKTWSEPVVLWHDEAIRRIQWTDDSTVVAIGDKGSVGYCLDSGKGPLQAIWKKVAPETPIAFVRQGQNAILGLCGGSVYSFDPTTGTSKRLFGTDLEGGDSNIWLIDGDVWVGGTDSISVHTLETGKLVGKTEVGWPYMIAPAQAGARIIITNDGRFFDVDAHGSLIKPIAIRVDNAIIDQSQQKKADISDGIHPSASETSEMLNLAVRAGRQVSAEVMAEASAKAELKTPRDQTLWIIKRLKERMAATQPGH